MTGLVTRMAQIDEIAQQIERFCNDLHEHSAGQVNAALILTLQRRAMRTSYSVAVQVAEHMNAGAIDLIDKAEETWGDGNG
jgi:hypothetical protein